jgi:hypothetical protein
MASEKDNTVYNLVTILHNKMKGVAAYDKYEQDFADNESLSDILEEIKSDDEEHIQILQQELRRVLPEQIENEADEDMQEEEEQESSRSKSQGRRQTQSANR